MSLPCPGSSGFTSAAANRRSNISRDVPVYSLGFERSKEKVKKLFEQIDISISSYDTAWVAMVPSPSSTQVPCFPNSLNWILENQLRNGSWGLMQHPLLVKDALSSTLACVLALKKWGIGETHINNGLDYIGSNLASIRDENQLSTIGFDIIFSGLMEHAEHLNLKLPLESADIDAIFRKREVELRSFQAESRRAQLAYISEGIGELQDWEMVLKYQRKNGSLFNSPSTTAAAFCHTRNDACLSYLQTVIQKFGNAVPTVYPFNIRAHLCMVDTLKSLGIDWHFRKEIKAVLDETYRGWLQGEEDIFLDPTTCAMAFRLLRVHGYDVSSAQASNGNFFSSYSGCLNDIIAVLELFKSSQVMVHPDETILEEQNRVTMHLLKEKMLKGFGCSDVFGGHVKQKVDDALKFPLYADLDLLAHRRNIRTYVFDSTSALKTSFRSSNIANKDVLKLAVEEFNSYRSQYHEELNYVEAWVKQYRLNELKFARQRQVYDYFTGAATMCSPELSYARIAWAKSCVLVTVADDLFDHGGSIEEMENLVQLLDKFDSPANTRCCETVKIIYAAIHDTITEFRDKAFSLQGYDVTCHLTQAWMDFLKSILQEALWARNKTTPSIEEYMKIASVSFTLGPLLLPLIYLVGPQISLEIGKSSETRCLLELVSIVGRLANDIQSYERELAQGKLNSVFLLMIHGNATCIEDAVEELKRIISDRTRELLRSVLQEKGSILPRACKDVFWCMCKVLHQIYMKDDGFTSEKLFAVIDSAVGQPILRDDI